MHLLHVGFVHHAAAALAQLLVVVAAADFPGGAAAEGSAIAAAAPSRDTSPSDGLALLADLESMAGSPHPQELQERLGHIERELLPTFTAMHKNEHGNLGPAGTRYVLHRYFMQKYSWLVEGLDTAGGAWNSSWPTELIRGYAPAGLLRSFEGRLGGVGFGVHDAAVLAAAVQALVRAEAVASVRALYRVHGRRAGDALAAGDVDSMLDTYLAAHILQVNLTRLVERSGGPAADWAAWRGELHANVANALPDWPETQKFVRGLRGSSESVNGTYTFPAVVAIVDQVLGGWGRMRNGACQNNKRLLLAIEDESMGCVRLADFYRSMAEDGVWQFAESRAYLRAQGILEESNPADPHVIIPNYVTSRGNCVASSRFYSTCCASECEGILDSLEQQFGAPSATATEIAFSIALLPSATVPPRRALSPELLYHLDDVANMHDGRVFFHSRLFLQWMHHAYPRECPYPHLSGTTLQRSIFEIENRGQASIVVTAAQAEEAIGTLPRQPRRAAEGAPRATEGTCVPWHPVEELIVEPPATMKPLAALEAEPAVWMAAQCIAMASALAAAAVSLTRVLRTARRGAGAPKDLPALEV